MSTGTYPAYLQAMLSTRTVMMNGDPSSFELANARRSGVVK